MFSPRLGPAEGGGPLPFSSSPHRWGFLLQHLHFSSRPLPSQVAVLTPALSCQELRVLCSVLHCWSRWSHRPLIAWASSHRRPFRKKWSLSFQFPPERGANSSSCHGLIAFLMPLVFCFISAFAQRMTLELKRRTPLCCSRTLPCRGAGTGRRASSITPTCAP